VEGSTKLPEPTPGGAPPGAPGPEERFAAQLVWGLSVIAPVLGPYLMWKLQAKDSAFVGHHARASSNHALTVMVLFLVACVVLGVPGWLIVWFVDLGNSDAEFWFYVIGSLAVGGLLLLVLLGLGLVTLVVHFVALLKAGRGEWYVPALCWRFMR